MKSIETGAMTPKTNMRNRSWQLSAVFLVLSLLMSGWIASEMGLLGFTNLWAGDKEDSALESLRKSLEEKEKVIGQKEREISERTKAIAEKEKILNEQIEKYEKEMQELLKKVAEMDQIKNEKQEAFRDIYAKMDAKKSAKVLEEVSVDLAAWILSGMKPDKAAEVLGNLNTGKAKLITERYFGNRKIAQTKDGK